MSWGETRTWRYLGSNVVKYYDGVRRIEVPERVFEIGILDKPEAVEDEASDADTQAYWNYDRATGWVILSNAYLENEPNPDPADGDVVGVRYQTQDPFMDVSVGDDDDQHRITVPSQFFVSSEGGTGELSDQVTDEVRIQPGEERHFVTADEFLEDDPTPTKSCFVLTTSELETLFRNNDVEPDAPYITVPRLFS